MRTTPVTLCSLLSAATLGAFASVAAAQQAIEPASASSQQASPESAVVTPAVQPAAFEGEGTAAIPAIPGTVDPPVTEPEPAIPGVVAPPIVDDGLGGLLDDGMATGIVPPSQPDAEANERVSRAVAQTSRTAGPSISDFQNEDIPLVLRLLARQAGVNLVVSDLVQGTITMRLENLTALEAINVIVTAKGLIIDKINNVYYIKTLAEKQREPTESGSYTFSYATAEKVAALLRAQLQSGVQPQFDERTNTIYYREFKSNMDNIELFLESVDRPTQQVMIEARLVEVNGNPKQSYGINWAGVLGGSDSAQTFTFAGANTVSADGAGGTEATLGDLLFSGRKLSSLKAVGGQLAILSAPQMSATLRLLNEDADAEFLANPRVVTANNLEAKIEIVRNQPIPQLNFNEQTATAVFGGFTDKLFGNTLLVRPTINKDDFITMLVKPTISNKVDDAVYRFAGAEVTSPIIDERSLESTVLIKSGETLAIGGLLQDEAIKRRSKVPVLGDIPVVGYAFQERVNERRKRNLLVFVTPTIIKQGYGTGLEDQVSGLKNSGEDYADPNGWRNNARGAVRLVPTANRQISADYPKPGTPPAPAIRGQRKAPPAGNR